jgi:hypothetical protein
MLQAFPIPRFLYFDHRSPSFVVGSLTVFAASPTPLEYLCNGWEHYVPTDASRFLISCVIQHYAPVVGGGGGGGTDA